jgi:hypothetical protein
MRTNGVHPIKHFSLTTIGTDRVGPRGLHQRLERFDHVFRAACHVNQEGIGL